MRERERQREGERDGAKSEGQTEGIGGEVNRVQNADVS